MYAILLSFHALFRWLVLLFLITAIGNAWWGLRQNSTFTNFDNKLRHWTATIAHLQLIIGLTLYFKSPLIQYFWGAPKELSPYKESSFFGFYHLLLMIIAVVTVTIGSALAKRQTTDQAKFKTMLLWFGVTLLLIFIAIPWPFSPFVNRPYLRAF